jgi:hypothetical protein
MSGPEGVPADNPAGVPQRDRDLTLTAVREATRGDWAAAQQAVDAISTETGGALYALVAWADWTVGWHAKARGLPLPSEVPGGVIVRPLWADPGTGRIEADADAVSPPARWAGRFIAARAALDHEQCQALIGVLPADSRECGRYVSALLSACAAAAREAGAVL